MAAKRDSMYCEHDRTAATCEECAHVAARADGRRAAATREELYPFPESGAITTRFLSEDEEPSAPKKAAPRRRRS
jgi:hypothetical protein